MIKNATFQSNRIQYLYDLLYELVNRDIKLRYKRSVLGIVWSLLNPLAQMLVLNFVFNVILPTRIENFTLFLFTGILAWGWFRGALYASTSAIVQNGMLIRRPGFPVAMLPIVTVTTHLIHYILALPILLIFIVAAKSPINWTYVAFPFVMMVQFVIILSLAYIVAGMHVTFRDTQYLLDIFLLFGFYLSPIFYAPTSVPERVQFLYNLNPMVHIITAYRDIFLAGQFPDFPNLLVLFGASLLTLKLGHMLFSKASFRFVEEI